MKVNLFLTDVAKGYGPDIRAVYFHGREQGPLGAVFRFKGEAAFRIEIDAARLECVHQKLFVFFHELGHIVLGHCNTGNILKNGPEHLARGREDEANTWALNEMGSLDSGGRVKPGDAHCVGCTVKATGIQIKSGLLEGQSGPFTCNRGQ